MIVSLKRQKPYRLLVLKPQNDQERQLLKELNQMQPSQTRARLCKCGCALSVKMLDPTHQPR